MMTTQHILMFIVLVAFFGGEVLWLFHQGREMDRKYGDPSEKAPPAGE